MLQHFNELSTHHDRIIYFQNWRDRVLSFLNGIAELTLEDVSGKKDSLINQIVKSGPYDDHSLATEVADLDRAHERFHTALGEIIRLKNSGDAYEARMKFIDLDRVIASCVTAYNRIDDRMAKLA